MQYTTNISASWTRKKKYFTSSYNGNKWNLHKPMVFLFWSQQLNNSHLCANLNTPKYMYIHMLPVLGTPSIACPLHSRINGPSASWWHSTHSLLFSHFGKFLRFRNTLNSVMCTFEQTHVRYGVLPYTWFVCLFARTKQHSTIRWSCDTA